MAISKVSSMNSLFNSIYEDAIFVARENNLMAALVTTYSATGYAARILPVYPQLTAQVVAEGVDYSNPQEFTKTAGMTLTPQEVMAQSILTDQRNQTDPDNARRDNAIELGAAIATKVDTDIVDLFTGFSTGKGSANSALTIANVAAAISVLRKNKARNPLFAVLHPYHWHDIWVLLGQPASQQAFLGDVANQAMRDYAVGQFLAAQWYTDANISVDSSDDAISAVFAREALALDIREAPTMEPERDASLRAWELNMHMGYAVGERLDSAGVKLTADATEPT